MTSQGASRRISVATVGLLSIVVSVTLIAAAGRVSGEPSRSTAPTTSARSTTSTTLPLYPVDPPNPLRLYPRRPGAKYDDVELKPDAVASDGVVRLRLLTWQVEPHAALPARSTPAPLPRYSSAGLIDGYVPYTTHAPGDVLRIVLRENPAGALPVDCVATAASDGTVLVPYQTPVSSSSTVTPASGTRVTDGNYYLPLGARRGRFYLTCRLRLDVPLLLGGLDARFVWGIDV